MADVPRFEIPEEKADGIYSNAVHIMFTPYEFVLDFGHFVPGSGVGKVDCRIVTSPQHAKQLAQVLQSNVQAYEDQFGKLPTLPGPDKAKPLGFQPEAKK